MYLLAALPFAIGICAMYAYALIKGDDGGPDYDNRDWSGW